MSERRKDLYSAPRRRTREERQYINPAAMWNQLREAGRDLTWLAERIGVNRSTIDDWLAGSRKVPHKRADRLLEVLHLPESKLLSPTRPRRVEAERGARELWALPYVNSERIRDELARRGWTVTELARKVGVSRRSMQRILAEKQRVRVETQVALSQALDLAREEVVDLEPVDPVFDTSRVMDEPAAYKVRDSLLRRALVIRPRAVSTLTEAFSAQAGLPCGCVAYWQGPAAPRAEALDEIRDHYRRHAAGLMEEPGLGTDRQNPRLSPDLPRPYERMGTMLWPRLPTGEGGRIRP